MGASIKYVGEKRRKTALRRAIWDILERELDQKLDVGAVYEITDELCRIMNFVVEDMKNVGEFNRIGLDKKHHYTVELYISEDKVTSQNTLEGAGSLPAHPPTGAQPWLELPFCQGAFVTTQ